jgi:hypothetical protein
MPAVLADPRVERSPNHPVDPPVVARLVGADAATVRMRRRVAGPAGAQAPSKVVERLLVANLLHSQEVDAAAGHGGGMPSSFWLWTAPAGAKLPGADSSGIQGFLRWYPSARTLSRHIGRRDSHTGRRRPRALRRAELLRHQPQDRRPTRWDRGAAQRLPRSDRAVRPRGGSAAASGSVRRGGWSARCRRSTPCGWRVLLFSYRPTTRGPLVAHARPGTPWRRRSSPRPRGSRRRKSWLHRLPCSSGPRSQRIRRLLTFGQA